MTFVEVARRNLIQTANQSMTRRLRRLRTTPVLRGMVRETELNARDFIYPLFVRHGHGRNDIRLMPGIFQLSVEERLVTLETLTAIKRAGAELIITYHAKDAACWLNQ